MGLGVELLESLKPISERLVKAWVTIKDQIAAWAIPIILVLCVRCHQSPLFPRMRGIRPPKPESDRMSAEGSEPAQLVFCFVLEAGRLILESILFREDLI
jgi:hypothetical protein